jgi:GxxExxY protein
MAFLHEDLTREIIEACHQVSNELGAGFLERVYAKALTIVLEEKGLQFQSEVPLSVHFHGTVIGHYVADLIVEDKVLIELKAVTGLIPEHQAQVINYLKATDIEVGLLVNFGRPRIEIKRMHK